MLAFDVPAGWVISRFGERAGMAAASGTVILTLAGWALTGSIAVFAVLAFVQGCGWSAWQLARLAYVAEVVPGRAARAGDVDARRRDPGGDAVGPFAGAAVSAVGGLDAVFVFAVVLVAVATVGAVRHGPLRRGPPARRVSRCASARSCASTRTCCSPSGLAATAIQALRQARNALLPLWADHLGLSPQTASILFGLSLLVEVLLVYPGGTVLDRRGRKAVAVPCLVTMGIGLALLPLTHDLAQLALVAALLGAGNGLSSGVVMTLGADLAPAATRVSFLGVWRVFGDVGTAGGPLAVALATAATTLGGAAVLVGAGGVAAALYVVRFVPETMRRSAR